MLGFKELGLGGKALQAAEAAAVRGAVQGVVGAAPEPDAGAGNAAHPIQSPVQSALVSLEVLLHKVQRGVGFESKPSVAAAKAALREREPRASPLAWAR